MQHSICLPYRLSVHIPRSNLVLSASADAVCCQPWWW